MSSNRKVINVSYNLSTQRIMVKTTKSQTPTVPPFLALSSILDNTETALNNISMDLKKSGGDYVSIGIIEAGAN